MDSDRPQDVCPIRVFVECWLKVDLLFLYLDVPRGRRALLSLGSRLRNSEMTAAAFGGGVSSCKVKTVHVFGNCPASVLAVPFLWMLLHTGTLFLLKSRSLF